MTVGILGAGQLGRMLALAGFPLRLDFVLLDPAEAPCASGLGTHMRAPYDDAEALEAFARAVDVVTYEFENVPSATADLLAARVPVYPPPRALSAAQDRLAEKELFGRLGIPTAPYAAVANGEEASRAAARLGGDMLLKTRRFGYDGKGQARVRSVKEAIEAFGELGSVPCLLEGRVDFHREVSMLGVRGRDGEIRTYPLVENVHEAGILRRSIAPAPDHGVGRLASEAMGAVLEALDYVGVLAIEFFHVGDGLLANEMAPRVHNSGHWTIEGAETSQFENHVRAVAGLPLGDTRARGHSIMRNLIGGTPAPANILAVPGAHLHLYDKAPRHGRKIGHVTLRGDRPDGLKRADQMLEEVLRGTEDG